MRGAKPWFDGHDQPRVPLLGELDERKPATWECYIDLAADHGIDAFIWDWYWYDGEPALHEALEDGFLRARNRDRVKFSVMWTNHPWTRVYPTLHTDGTDGWAHLRDAPDVTLEDAWRSLSYLTSRYFHQTNYWRLNGRPVLAVWTPESLIRKHGIEDTRALFDELRAMARRMGHDGIHLHAPLVRERHGDLEALGFDSYGFYTSLPQAAGLQENASLPDFEQAIDHSRDVLWPEADARSALPMFPNANPGWDTTPRLLRNYQPAAGPVDPTWPGKTYWGDPVMFVNETPAGFRRFVQAAIEFVQARPEQPQVVTLGCWNEFTEGHYLLPDTRFGYGMLQALAEARTGERVRSPNDWTHDFFGVEGPAAY